MTMSSTRVSKTFREWLKSDEPLIVAEGYIFEFNRRGYIRGCDFVPYFVLEHPELVTQLHEEFVHAGTDVTLAFTFYMHREKMASVGKEDQVEKINKISLGIAKEIAQRTNTFFAGNLYNTNFMIADKTAETQIRAIYQEQINWAVESGVEFIVAETLSLVLEAKIAIELTKAAGLPIVVTFNLYTPAETTMDDIDVVEACKIAEDAGADVVGLNCGRGPETIVPLLRRLRNTCKGPLAALPVCYRTSEKEKTWLDLTHPTTGEKVYPKDIAMFQSCNSDIEKFGKACQEIGIRYVGLCCGNYGSLTRTLAQTFGRCPPGDQFSWDISKTIKGIFMAKAGHTD